jgi:SAM-dependent methyltransferase
VRDGRRPEPGWRRLVAHSYRIGGRWLATGPRTRWAPVKPGLNRLLVPLDPWRYYELGRLAEEEFPGRNLDVASPKLLASLLSREGRGRWVAVDLFAEEIEAWRRLDPDLDLRVEDARRLSFPDGGFDGCVCVSVVEHIPGGGDGEAMAEMWRVLRPGGTLHLTTNVSARGEEVWIDEEIYGAASERVGERVFFERRYTEASLAERLLGLPWEETAREYVRQARDLHRVFYGLRPWSFLAGGALRLVCPRNFRPIATPAALRPGEHGVVYLRLRKPLTG